MNFRVVLSIAAMWSASKACRIPRVYAVMAIPIPSALRCWGKITTNSKPHPITCSPRMKAAIPPALPHSAGVRLLRIRASRPAGLTAKVAMPEILLSPMVSMLPLLRL